MEENDSRPVPRLHEIPRVRANKYFVVSALLQYTYIIRSALSIWRSVHDQIGV